MYHSMLSSRGDTLAWEGVWQGFVAHGVDFDFQGSLPIPGRARLGTRSRWMFKMVDEKACVFSEMQNPVVLSCKFIHSDYGTYVHIGILLTLLLPSEVLFLKEKTNKEFIFPLFVQRSSKFSWEAFFIWCSNAALSDRAMECADLFIENRYFKILQFDAFRYQNHSETRQVLPNKVLYFFWRWEASAILIRLFSDI